MLIVDLGLYSGRLEIAQLSPQVLERLNGISLQIQKNYSETSSQLRGLIDYVVENPPTMGHALSSEIVNLSRQLLIGAGSLQFSLSLLSNLRNRMIQEASHIEGLKGSDYLVELQRQEDLPVNLSANQWYTITRRLTHKLSVLLGKMKKESIKVPLNVLSQEQAEALFFMLGLQSYPMAAAEAMAVLVESCSQSPWWISFLKNIIHKVLADKKPLFYSKERLVL